MEEVYTVKNSFEKFTRFYFSSFTIKEIFLFIFVAFILFLLSALGLSIRVDASFTDLIFNFSDPAAIASKAGPIGLIALAPILRVPVFYANWRSSVILKEDRLLFYRPRLILSDQHYEVLYSDIDKVIIGDNGDITCMGKKGSGFIPTDVTFYKTDTSKQLEIMNFLKQKIPHINDIVYKSSSYSIKRYSYFQN